MQYPTSPEKAAHYDALYARSTSFARHLAKRVRDQRRIYRRTPDAREAVPVGCLVDAHLMAITQLIWARDHLARARSAPASAVQAARLRWRVAELVVAERRVQLSSMRLRHANGHGLAEQVHAEAA